MVLGFLSLLLFFLTYIDRDNLVAGRGRSKVKTLHSQDGFSEEKFLVHSGESNYLHSHPRIAERTVHRTLEVSSLLREDLASITVDISSHGVYTLHSVTSSASQAATQVRATHQHIALGTASFTSRESIEN